MQARDKINKAVMNQFEATKDIVAQNLLTAAKAGHIIIGDVEMLDKITRLVSSSLMEGYHKGNNVLMREVDAALNDKG